MPFINNDSGPKKIYLEPKNGFLVQAYKTPKDGFEPETRTNSKGEKFIKYVKKEPKLQARFVSLEKIEDTFGPKWVLVLEDATNTYEIKWKYSSGYTRTFFNQFVYADLSKDLTINASASTFTKDSDGSTGQSVGLWISQDGESLPYFSKGDQKDLVPPVEELEFKGKMEKDDTKQVKFFVDKAMELINKFKMESTKAAGSSTEAEPSTGASTPTEQNNDPVTDDLPF